MVKTALDNLTPPPSLQLLGWRLLDARPQEAGSRSALMANASSAIRPASWLSHRHDRSHDGSSRHRDERGQALCEYGQH